MRRRRTIWIAAGLALGASWTAAYVFRDEVATHALALAVDNIKTLQCNHASVHITPSLRRIHVTPLDCTIEGKPMKHLSTHSDAVVTMGLVGIDDVHIERATVDYKERDLSNVTSNTLGDIAAFTGVSDKLVKSLLDASENHSTSAPPIRIDTLTIQRAGETSAVMHDFSKTPDGIWERTSAAKVTSGPIEINDFDMRATPSQGRLTGEVHLGKAVPDVALEIKGAKLDTQQPSVTLHVR
jgi:hypothetical protein